MTRDRWGKKEVYTKTETKTKTKGADRVGSKAQTSVRASVRASEEQVYVQSCNMYVYAGYD